MPVIRGETHRGLRLLPGMRADQATLVAATAAITWAAWHLDWPRPARWAVMTAIALAGGGLAFFRWPPGPHGEALSVWVSRWARFLARPRRLVGARVPGWDAVQALGADGLVHTPGRQAVIMECSGTGSGLAGDAGQRAWRQLLHGVRAPLELVTEGRWADALDAPARWGTRTAETGVPADVAAEYAAHWTRLVAEHRVVVRRSLLVVTAPAGVAARAQLDADVDVVRSALGAIGVVARTIAGPEAVELLHRAGGAAEAVGPLPPPGGWSVRRGV